MTQREEFESAFKGYNLVRSKSDSSKYGDKVSQRMWEAYQEGFKAAKAQAEAQWIPVGERLPDEGTYFCLGHNGTPFVCLLRNKKYEGCVWLRNTGTRRVDGITHWMPLPAAPDGDK